jgi:hypothetical protein
MAGAHRPDVTAIPLGRPLPDASSNQPERRGQRIRPCDAESAACRSYSVLLPAGLAMPLTLPPARCALTAPFHPCLLALRPCGLQSGGLLSVALSLGSPPPDVIRRRIRMEPGLSSAFQRRPSGRLADDRIGVRSPDRQAQSDGTERTNSPTAARGTNDRPRSLKLQLNYGIVASSRARRPPRLLA